MSDTLPTFDAFSVKESSKKGKKPYWTKIGAAWPNDKGGFQIKLNALPLDDTIVLLPPRDNTEGS